MSLIAVPSGAVGRRSYVSKKSKIASHALLDQIVVSTNAVGKLRNASIDYFIPVPLRIISLIQIYIYIYFGSELNFYGISY